MADLEINVKGIDATVKSLNRINSSGAIRSAISASVIEIETYMKKYPPKPAAIQGPAMSPCVYHAQRQVCRLYGAVSRDGWTKRALYYEGYKRTGKLGQAWTTSVRQTATETVGKVGNAINYANGCKRRQTRLGCTRGDGARCAGNRSV